MIPCDARNSNCGYVQHNPDRVSDTALSSELIKFFDTAIASYDPVKVPIRVKVCHRQIQRVSVDLRVRIAGYRDVSNDVSRFDN